MLPNVAGIGAQATELTTWITKFEPQYLKAMLGVAMYNDYVSGISGLDPIYEAIRDGEDYTDDGDIERTWEGLGGVGTSPIANYVYYHLMKYKVSQTQGVGESMSAVENGTRANSIPKMVEAWNQMVDWNRQLHDYLMVNEATFPDYIGILSPSENEYLRTKINIHGI